MNREIIPTRYADDSYLCSLGLFDSVHWMINVLGLSHFYARRDVTYARLTVEFLSSLIYVIQLGTASTARTVRFQMFNKEYAYSTDQIAEMLNFPYGEAVICETPLEPDWVHNIGEFWKQLTGYDTDSFEGNVTSQIHNLAIRYFHRILADTIWSG